MTDLLRIGEFAKLGRVSVKALRFYAAKELLVPDYVDDASGYRYYRIAQLSQLALISNLRAADFSIADISAIIDAGADARDMMQIVEARRERLLVERANIDSRLNILETLSRSLWSDQDDPLSVVRLDSVPAQKVHRVSATVPRLGAPVTALFESAEAEVGRHAARLPTSPFLVFHDPPTQRAALAVEVCIPVIEDCSPDLDTSVVEGHDLACCVVYSGDYAQTETLGDTMLKWADDVGMRVTGPLREVYHRFGADQKDYDLPATLTASSTAEFVTELQMPVANDF